ncbi:MAG: hypothetical protein QOF21_832 [Actinomycetota bacterium]|jgi:pimeloyl-ACP methyl ester carboxylesterase
MDVRVVATARGRVEAAVLGSGPPVLLIHGMPGSWRQAVTLGEDLAAQHTVVLPSRPGYGRTPIRSGRSAVDQAALYAALLDALGLSTPADIVGISGGGPSAVAFAQSHPDRAASLTLMCALADHLMPVPPVMRVGVRVTPLALALTARERRQRRAVLTDDAKIDDYIAKELTADELRRASDDPAIREDLITFVRSHTDAPLVVAGFANDVAQLHRGRRRGPQPVDRISAPTLVLHGDADTIVGLPHAQHHASAIPGAELHVFAGAGHVFLITRKAEATAMLRAHMHASAS